MRLRDLPLKAVYNSEKDNILRDFYIPALGCSCSYSRAVGFFSASALSYAAQGVTAFVHNQGKMRLIVGAELDPEEHDAVLRGYEERSAIAESLSKSFYAAITQVNEALFLKRLEALQWLVSQERLDIKVALRRRGMYHEKIGILEDSTGDFIVFQGSANESLHALSPDFNYESINIFRSWREGEEEYFNTHLESFNTLWSGRSKDTLVMDFPEASRRDLLTRQLRPLVSNQSEIDLAFRERKMVSGAEHQNLTIPRGFEALEHQRLALAAWQEQDGIGILDLATGAGKTFAALYAATKFLEVSHRLFLVIAVPYEVLAEQWQEELLTFGGTSILCSSRNSSWAHELARKVDAYRAERLNFVAVVCVNATLASDQFQEIIARIKDRGTFLFVGDECHHHGSFRYCRALPENAGMRLGLSATYERHGDPDGTARLESYYGSVAYTFTLSDAIDKGFLVPYRYNLVLVELTDSEGDVYSEITRKISERLNGLRSQPSDIKFDDPVIKALLLRRSRFLGTLASKRQKLAEMLEDVDLPPRTLIYCGEGRSLVDEDESDDSVPQDDLLNIDLITKIISDKGYRVAKFTSQEPASERREILSMFRTGNIEVLTAIRCLDEGVNIPACETAFILASSSNPRQFIQRRGRILRKSPGKLSATLWDFLALPPSSSRSEDHEMQMLRRELARISEFSRHSLNFRETYDLLSPLLDKYDLGADFLLGGSGSGACDIDSTK